MGKKQMRTFKSYLNEVRVPVSTSDLVFKPHMSASSIAPRFLNIPISPSIFKRIWPNTIRATVFHTTDAGGVKDLVKIEGKKKSISAFFAMDSRYMESGVATEGGVHAVLEMEADVLISAKGDIMSVVDKTGRRWTSVFDLRQITYTDFKQIERDLDAMITKLLKKYLTPIYGLDKVKNMADKYAVWSDMKQIVDNKTLSLMIKDYMDEIEKLIKKNIDNFTSAMLGYINRRRTDENWDEQVVNNIKVKTAHFLKLPIARNDDQIEMSAKQEELIEFTESKGWSAKIWNAPIDLEIYIREVAKKEIGK